MALERGERDARNAMSRIRIAAQERLIAELDTVHGFEERETANYRRQIDDLSVRQRYDIATSDDVSEVSTLRDDQGASTPLSELRHIEPVRAPTIGSLVDTAIAVIEREQREARSLACSASGPPPQIPRMLQRSITIAEPETTQAIRDEQLAAMPRLTDEELFKQENKSWNFMLAQMHDWNERERSWARFRETLETKKGGLLARRLGLKKRSLSRG